MACGSTATRRAAGAPRDRIETDQVGELLGELPPRVLVRTGAEHVIQDITSWGELDQMLLLRGNRNIVRNLVKEGGTGTTDEPYIRLELHTGDAIGRTGGNVLEDLLIEGAGHAGKFLIEAEDVEGLTIRRLWHETTARAGVLKVTRSDKVMLDEWAPGLNGLSDIIVIADHSEVSAPRLNVDDEDTRFDQIVQVDDSSVLYVGTLRTKRASDVGLVAARRNVMVDRHLAGELVRVPVAGRPALVRTPSWAGEADLIVNGSFEQGLDGWQTWNEPATATFPPAEIGDGFGAALTWAGISEPLYQVVTVPEHRVGQPLTLTAFVKVDGEDGFAAPFVSGAGLEDSNGLGRIAAGTGWQILRATVYPAQAGTLELGIGFYAVTAGAERRVESIRARWGDTTA
jgi:hypothetical protein